MDLNGCRPSVCTWPACRWAGGLGSGLTAAAASIAACVHRRLEMQCGGVGTWAACELDSHWWKRSDLVCERRDGQGCTKSYVVVCMFSCRGRRSVRITCGQGRASTESPANFTIHSLRPSGHWCRCRSTGVAAGAQPLPPPLKHIQQEFLPGQ